MGQKKLAGIAYSFDRSVKWNQLFPKALLIALAIAILTTVFLTVILNKLMVREIVGPLLLDVENKTRQAAIGKITTQVAHDIRSPVAALEMMTRDLMDVPEERQIIIKSAIARIRDIASDLIKNNRPSEESESLKKATALESHNLAELVDEIASEKKMQFGTKAGVEIVCELKALDNSIFALLHPGDFKRVLSNLINNSVEALDSAGQVTITLLASSSEVEISIIDNGRGIPPKVIPTLFKWGGTHSKPEGSGLGLHHAKMSVESWSGKLELRSSLGKGTTVTLKLPRAEPPHGFVSKLKGTPI